MGPMDTSTSGAEYLTRSAAAHQAQVSLRTIARWLAEGRLTRYTQEGRKAVYVDAQELEALTQVRPAPPVETGA